jgi:hypothetical protein
MITLDSERIRLETQSRRADTVLPFSVEAMDRLTSELAACRMQWTHDAARLASHDGVDVVSECHVRTAARRSTGRIGTDASRIINTFGGVLLGAGCSLAVKLLQVQLTQFETIVTLLACTVGVALVIWHPGSDRQALTDRVIRPNERHERQGRISIIA